MENHKVTCFLDITCNPNNFKIISETQDGAK